MDLQLDHSTNKTDQGFMSQVSPSTDFTGYHYETDIGLHTTFFWQASSNILYATTLLKSDPSWVPIRSAIPVASDAKKNTPITAVNWTNGLKAAVYYLDGTNIIHERVSDDSGITWRDGGLSALSIPTRSFSDLNADISDDNLNAIYIRLYFQDSRNLIRELRCSVNGSHWHEEMSTGYDKLHAMGRTRIVCGERKEGKSILTQSVGKGVQEFWQVTQKDPGARAWVVSADKNYFLKFFDRGAYLGYTYTDLLQRRFYAYDSGAGTVIERIYDVSASRWQDPTTLPTSTGTSRILPNFIALSWPQDIDCTIYEVHLFSIDQSGLLWDYLVGLGTANSVSLLETPTPISTPQDAST